MSQFDRESHRDEWPRTIIEYLRTTDDGTASLDELIESIIDQQSNATTPDGEPVTYETVTYEVVHDCLPTLADQGVVEFDERAEMISYRPLTER